MTAAGEAPDVIRDRMKVRALFAAAEFSVDWVSAAFRTEPPAEPRYSMKLQVSPSYEAPCQTKPYLTRPLFLSMTASLSSCCQVLGTARPSFLSRSFR